MGIEANKRLALEFIEALSRGDADAIEKAFADDGFAWTAGSLPFSGVHPKPEVRALSEAVLGAFPQGLEFTVHSITAEDDRVAIEAESDGMHASGKHYHNTYHFLVRVRGGKILEWREYFDTMHANEVLCAGS